MIEEFEAIHQLVPRVVGGDAVSGHTLQAQRLLRERGLASEVYVQDVGASTAGEVLPFSALRPAPRTAVLYHLAIGSAVADDLLALSERGVRIAVDYHNLTPPEFFTTWADATAEPLAWGRRQLAKLAWPAGVGLGDSAYNVTDLVACGYRRTAVAPFLLDTDHLTAEHADPEVLRRLQRAKLGGGADWLFVGRVAPNKCQHDVVKAFAAYRRTVDPQARLHLVGGSSARFYHRALRRLVAGLGLGDAVELTGAVSPEALAAHYAAADVLVVLSEHEGFCVPLLEAFSNDVPVVAFDAGAVGETLGRGGVLLPDKSPSVVAAAVERVLGDERLRAALAEAGRRRLQDFSLERTGPLFLEGLDLMPLEEPPDVEPEELEGPLPPGASLPPAASASAPAPA